MALLPSDPAGQVFVMRAIQIPVFLALGWILGGCGGGLLQVDDSSSHRIRIATYNVEDIRTEDLLNPDHPRLIALANRIRSLQPDILLLNEVAYDQKGAPDFPEGEAEGQNGERLVQNFLRDSGLAYRVFTAPSNTGVASGFDLDNNGSVFSVVPPQPAAPGDGSLREQTVDGRNYGNDSWGFGTFPGQYAMVLLVRETIEILHDQIRMFQLLRWSSMPDALRPFDPSSAETWYSDTEWSALRLSSKNHWDVPVRLPDDTIIHLLCSHPTPPSFDGPERRNKMRNHDEIRFWADYLSGASYIIDDKGRTGGFSGSRFVILGDLNADPDEGNSMDNPIGRYLLANPLINSSFTPAAKDSTVGLDRDDTAAWGLRVDYVLPSAGFTIHDGGIGRARSEGPPVSDHFPVWLDLSVRSFPSEVKR